MGVLAKIDKDTNPRLYWIALYSICELTNRGWNKLSEFAPPKTNLSELVDINQKKIIEEDTSFFKKFSYEVKINGLISENRHEESIELIDSFLKYLVDFGVGTEFHFEIADWKR